MTPEKKEKNYPLHKAIKHRNIQKIKILLSAISDINEKNQFGYPPLLYACEQREYHDILKLVFAKGGIDPLATDNDGQIALHILAFNGDLYWIKEFYNKFPNVDVDTVCDKGNTPLIMAAKMDNVEVIEYFYEKGANINHENEKKFTALHYAANNGYVKTTKWLLDHGANIDASDNYGNTPLIKCSGWNFIDVCQLLISYGADINAKNNVGSTALYFSVRRDFPETVKYLLKNGADPNIVTNNEYISYSPICSTALSKNLDVLRILIEYGADINFPGEYSLVLFNCIKTDFYEGVVELINAGVNIRGRHETSKRTPLEYAEKMKKHNIKQLLLNNL